METLTVSRKQTLLKRAELYHHAQIFLPNVEDYVRGVLHEPVGFKDYDSGKEPIVDADEAERRAAKHPRSRRKKPLRIRTNRQPVVA